MLGDISVADEIYIVCGYTDMRRSIDGLCAIVQDRLHMDPRQRALYLFCGKRCDRLKALLWEGDGFLLLYKRMEAQGRFRWPRNSEEVRSLTWQQFDWLMSGLEIEQPKAFKVPKMWITFRHKQLKDSGWKTYPQVAKKPENTAFSASLQVPFMVK